MFQPYILPPLLCRQTAVLRNKIVLTISICGLQPISQCFISVKSSLSTVVLHPFPLHYRYLGYGVFGPGFSLENYDPFLLQDRSLLSGNSKVIRGATNPGTQHTFDPRYAIIRVLCLHPTEFHPTKLRFSLPPHLFLLPSPPPPTPPLK